MSSTLNPPVGFSTNSRLSWLKALTKGNGAGVGDERPQCLGGTARSLAHSVCPSAAPAEPVCLAFGRAEILCAVMAATLFDF